MIQERKPCPYCGESIMVSAKKCRYCGEWIEIPSDKKPHITQSQSSTAQSVSPTQPLQTTQPATPVQQLQTAQSTTPVQPHQTTQPVAPAQTQQTAQSANPVQTQQTSQPVTQTFQYNSQTQYQSSETDYNQNSFPEPYEFEEQKTYFQKYFKEPFFNQFADFGGYISRKDYWMTILFYTIISLGVIGLSFIIMIEAQMYVLGIVLLSLYYLFSLIPSLALPIRRLRDAGKSPALIFINLIPFIGPLIFFILMCRPSMYEYPPEIIKFSTGDFCILIACVSCFFVGLCISFNSLGRVYGYDDSFYQSYYNEEYPYEVVEVDEVVAEYDSTENDYYSY